MAAEDMFETSWGSVRLWCARVETDGGRTLVVHDLVSGDEHPTSDRGAGQRPVRCELLFDEFPGEPLSGKDRLLAFRAQLERQRETEDGFLFQHPLLEPFYAKVDEFTWAIDEDSNIVDASCVFHPSLPIEAVLTPGLGSVPSLGLDAVKATADEINALLEDSVDPADLAAAELDPDFITEAAALPDAWLAEGDIPTRDILVDVARVTDQLASLTSLLEDDLALFGAYQAAILFGAAFRAAAVAATSETPRVFVVKIGTPTSVLALVTRTYGGAQAEDRERQVRALNDIRTPGGLLASGTELVMPAVTAA